MRRAFLLSLFLLFTMPVLGAAATRACSGALVTAGLCRSTSDALYSLPFSTVDPDGAGPQQAPSVLITAAFVNLFGYQTPTSCTAALVAAGVCTSGQVGQMVPITQSQFVDSQIRAYVLSVVRRYRVVQAVSSAQATAEATADPDLGQ
jgi:hypothetical protein